MANVTRENLELILSRVDSALTLHDKWRENFQRTLICNLPPSEADLSESAHEQCAFGHWLYSKTNEHLLSLSAFRSIEEVHKEMHRKARMLCERRRLPGHVTAFKDYDVYLDATVAFHAELLNLKERVAFMLHNIDPLTGVYQQAQLLHELLAEQQRQKATGEVYTLFLIGLDIKEINQKLGRSAGDKVLQAAIANVRLALSDKDQIYRVMGAEFVICLPRKNTQDAEQMKEPILEKIGEAVSAATDKSEPTFNVNYCIVELKHNASLEKLLDQSERTSHTIDLTVHEES